MGNHVLLTVCRQDKRYNRSCQGRLQEVEE